MKNAIIRCGICENEFLFDKTTVGKAIINGLRVSYFACPYCKHKYPYLLEDAKQMEILKSINILRTDLEIRNLNGKKFPAVRKRKLEKLLEKSEKYQASLRDNHIKAVTDQLNKSDS